MFYADSQRTVTRRDSSLVLSSRRTPYQYPSVPDDYDAFSTARPQSLYPSESGGSLPQKCKQGTVEKEIVTLMFNSMLDTIIESWELIPPPKDERERTQSLGIPKVPSDITVSSKKKKPIPKSSKTKRSRSKLDMFEEQEPASWFAPPDERAIIHFRNGNKYEGDISMKCMHGEGRFQWVDGTVYLGQFNDNEISGKGKIFWKDDTWYEGEFMDNLRHGHGLYVDSRKQRTYTGEWHCGTKHGEGVIYYSKTFKNSYSGQWVHNVRHGFGSREYCPLSGYKGEWNSYVREGKGLMIWPNQDFYRGQWKNGVMSGYGIYIWDAYYNNSMSLPSINAFRGNWDRGQRNGYGILNLGLGLGSHYKGEFKNNKKNGAGKFVTNNGFIIQHKHLFIDDNICPLFEKSYGTNHGHGTHAPTTDHKPVGHGHGTHAPATDHKPVGHGHGTHAPATDHKPVGHGHGTHAPATDQKPAQIYEPFQFDICDDTVGLTYHIAQAVKNIDKQEEIRAQILNEYFERNKTIETDVSHISYLTRKTNPSDPPTGDSTDLDDLMQFEEESLRKAIRSYETDLKRIYYTYATICNTEEIHFKPVLIRLYLWQFYFDCKVQDKGLNLVEIDNIFFENADWLARTPHDPFEKVYFWQFLHSLISVASRLYAKKQMPGPKPDTILASGFRTFMEKDVLPRAGSRKGRLAKGYASFIPLKALYALYLSLGEPHTIRQFLQAVRCPPHCMELPQPLLVDPPEDVLPLGRNTFIFGDDLTFVTDENVSLQQTILDSEYASLKLFNFGNLSSKAVVKVFSKIFKGVVTKTKKRMKNLEMEMTFYEFFEAFVACAEESIRVKDEEVLWREKFCEPVL